MGELVKKADISEEDYRAIEEAVMETARGRWFLSEYARRNRVADTDRVLNAIDEVKTFITREHEPADVMQMRLDIVDMTQKIEQIKTEIANTDHSKPSISDAQVELNVVVDETEQATSTILNSAEQIQGLCWEIRENGGVDAECDKIDEFATEIYMACSFQDMTGQRLRKVVQLTQMLEERLTAMVGLWDPEELERYCETPEKLSEVEALTNGPAMPGQAQDQSQIDAVLNVSENINKGVIPPDDLEWQEEDEDSDSDDPFIINDQDVDVDFDHSAGLPDDNEDDIVAFEEDETSEDLYDEPHIPENVRLENEQATATFEEIKTTTSSTTEIEDLEPLEQRSALFN